MTGVAAQMCGADNPALELEMTGNWGKRFAILSDLSPAATFIASVYNSPVDVENFAAEFEKIFSDVQNEFGWMYETKVDGKIFPINYTVWSDVLICPNCGEEHAINKQVPVLISYRVGKNKLRTKTPDDYDFEVLDKINALEIPFWFPTDRMCEGKESRRNNKFGITHSYHFYTRRNYFICSQLWSHFKNNDFK